MNGRPQIDAKHITEAVALGSLDRSQNGDVFRIDLRPAIHVSP